jgi:hypothetical protein
VYTFKVLALLEQRSFFFFFVQHLDEQAHSSCAYNEHSSAACQYQQCDRSGRINIGKDGGNDRGNILTGELSPTLGGWLYWRPSQGYFFLVTDRSIS